MERRTFLTTTTMVGVAFATPALAAAQLPPSTDTRTPGEQVFDYVDTVHDGYGLTLTERADAWGIHRKHVAVPGRLREFIATELFQGQTATWNRASMMIEASRDMTAILGTDDPVVHVRHLRKRGNHNLYAHVAKAYGLT